MKKLKYTKKIQNEVKSFSQLIDNYCSKLNKEYAKNVNKLLENIAKGENLNLEMLKEKYLNKLSDTTEETQIEVSEIKNDSNDNNDTENNDTNSYEEIIFDKIVINGSNYYYENKENGKIYNSSSNIVGVYKNKKFVLN